LKDEKKAKALTNDVSYMRAIEKHGTPEEKAAVFSGKAPMRKTAHAALARARVLATKAPFPIEDVVERELIAKCSSSQPQWQTADEMASTIRRATPSVRDALVRLQKKGLAEGHKGPDGVRFEYWVNGKPEPEAMRSLDVDVELRIIELEDVIREQKDEIARLKVENAELRARLGEKDGKSTDFAEQLEQLKEGPPH
jgi:hypothetical protein